MDTFPKNILHPATEKWRLAGVSIGGGIPTAGAPGLSRTDGGGFWMCWQTDIAIDTPQELKTASQVDALLDGGTVAMIVPAFEEATRPVNAGVGVVVSCVTSTPAALRATAIDVYWADVIYAIGGEKFSITHPTKGKRLYRVMKVGPYSGGHQTLMIRPPLREAVTTEALDFNNPGCVMRLANPDDWLGPIDATHSSVANPVWVEDLHAA